MFTTELVSLKIKFCFHRESGIPDLCALAIAGSLTQSTLMMFPSVCDTNSGAYRHWIVLIPPAYSPVRDTYTAYSVQKVPGAGVRRRNSPKHPSATGNTRPRPYR